MSQDAVVRARITAAERDAAAHVLSDMGLTVSDAIRMMLKRVAAEGALPFEVRVPNAKTVAALEESRTGRTTRYKSAEDLWNDADHAEDD